MKLIFLLQKALHFVYLLWGKINQFKLKSEFLTLFTDTNIQNIHFQREMGLL